MIESAPNDFTVITTANLALLPPSPSFLFGVKIRTMQKFPVFEAAQ